MLETSDNEAAEVLFRQAALATDRPASFGGGAETVHAVLEELGIDSSRDRILDGSGLARGNRLRPETLLSVIQVAASDEHATLRPVLTGMPVAGFSGSLTYRFDSGDPSGLGDVRAKTGTLTGVHGLAGTLTTRDGVVLGFVAIADKVKVPNTLEARARIDELAASLAACECGVTS
jgi:D-alanyl-D-alanine carboxypeptidase/D-alanyl-D-alanine-endopeptidase (penicillin-binding protein 4)